MQIILIGTMGATIWLMPFMDYWDNVISITSMAGKFFHFPSSCSGGGLRENGWSVMCPGACLIGIHDKL